MWTKHGELLQPAVVGEKYSSRILEIGQNITINMKVSKIDNQKNLTSNGIKEKVATIVSVTCLLL